jgi:lactate permease
MLDAAIAALPIVIVLVLMLVARWSAVRAGIVGATSALVVAVVAFPFESVDGGIAVGVLGAAAEAAFTSATILWIVLPALAIYSLQTATGAVDTLRDGLAGLTTDPRRTGLVVAWFFALLLEGAAGFGTSAALAAPFLVALGMTPVAAVVAAMVGHLVGVTFGAVGTPVVPMVAASGLEPVELSGAIAVQATVVGWTLPVIVAGLLGRSSLGRAGATWGLGLAGAVAFFVPYLLLARFVGPELPTLAGAIVGGGIFVIAVRRRGDDRAGHEPRAGGTTGLATALAPYLALVAVVLATRLVTPLRDVLEGADLSWEAADGTFAGSFAPLFHPGTMLFVALGVGAVAQGASRAQVRTAVAGSARTVVPVAGALLAMLGLARIMVHAGMVDAIAQAAADALGAGWPLLAPAVGALGTFVTGSATASNALFSDLQIATATQVGDPVAATLGAQGVGAALGNAIAPHNLIAAAAIVGLGGRESEILRRTATIALPLIAAAGVCALAVANA